MPQTRKALRLLFAISLLSTAGIHRALGSTEQNPVCAINRIDGAVATGGFLSITGFAADRERGAPVEKMEILLDGALTGEASLSGLRPDVATHFHRQDYLWSGWSASVSLENVPAGKHLVQIKAVSPSGKKASCGIWEVQVLPVPHAANPPAWKIAGVILFRTLVLLLWLGLVGWFPVRILGSRPLLLSAPLLGLALFAIFTETGSALKLRPFHSALALTGVSVLALLFSIVSRGLRFRRPGRTAALTLACGVFFAAIGVIPLASHGEGAVLGDIDDAVRECSVADSLRMYGFQVPSTVRGYLASIPAAMERAHVRLGGSYLLSALGEAFGERAHAVHSVAMLGAGCLTVLATGLLAFRALSRFPRLRWIAPVLVTANSILFATLYGQHLGSLLAAALFLTFLFHVIGLLRSPSLRSIAPVGVTIAAGFTLYPEVLPAWGLAALFSLGMVGSGRRRRRSLLRFAIAAALGLALNPLGFARAARFAGYAVTQPSELSSPESRLRAGDTHYFPSPGVITGIEAYREDAPAPVGRVRAVLIPLAGCLIVATFLLGLMQMAARERWKVLMLVAPPGVALLWNYHLNFPYGFAKFLPLAAPVWMTAFVLAALWAAAVPGRLRGRRGVLAWGTMTLLFFLSLPAARHVVLRATRAVPSYDSEFRALPALAANVQPAVIQIDEPLRARLEWMRYFLGDYAVEVATPAGTFEGVRGEGTRYRLLDRREQRQWPPGSAGRVSGVFQLVPSESLSSVSTGGG